MRKHTIFTDELEDGTEGTEIRLVYEPATEPLKAKIADKYVVAYLVADHDYDYDSLMGDCMGKLYSSHRWSGQHSEMQEALGLNSDWEPNLSLVYERHFDEAVKRYIEKLIDTHGVAALAEELSEDYEREQDEESDEAFVRACLREDCESARDWNYTAYADDMQDVLQGMFSEPAFFPGDKDVIILDCYDHGSQWWSLSGHGMQCPWDTARGAGVWVPDECLREQLDSDEANGEDRRAKAKEYCKQFLEIHNAICNGDVYGCVVHVYNEDGELDEIEIDDECWGFVGLTWAEKVLKEEFFDPKCKEVLSNYEHAVKTQGGRQAELPL